MYRCRANPNVIFGSNKETPLALLLDDLHGDDAFVVDRNVDVHIAAMRKKLGPRFDFIETVRGVGYRFCSDD